MKDPTTTRRRGRPTRAERSEKALAGVDLTGCDPIRILRQIAMDETAPSTSRVAACKVLLGLDPVKPDRDGARRDAVNDRAIELMRGRPN